MFAKPHFEGEKKKSETERERNRKSPPWCRRLKEARRKVVFSDICVFLLMG